LAIRDSTVEQVRQVPVTQVLKNEGIEMKRVGREAVTLCPWHNDSNPSLTLNDDKNICFCFACGGGSDAIAYIQQYHSLSFSDAVARIAEKNGIDVLFDDLDPAEALRAAEERRRRQEAIDKQQDAFRSGIQSRHGIDARAWLLSRGIRPETCREFGIGWARDGRFARRVTVPIHDHRGSLVGFTGRTIDDVTDENRKYVNSSSSDLFQKGALVYNEHKAIRAARSNGFLVFVEGHFDVIQMWQYGIPNTVAIQGTAAPMLQSIKRLSRYCKRFVLCYDGDSGGRKAIQNFVDVCGLMACKGEVSITVASLPEGSDPDDCIRNNVDLHGIIESAPQWLDWQIDNWLNEVDRSDTHRFSQIETAIRKLVESITSPALRQHYIDKASKVLTDNQKSAVRLAQKWRQDLPAIRVSAQWEKPDPAWTRHQVEKRAIRAYIHVPECRERLAPLMHHLQTPSFSWLWGRIQELERLTENLDSHLLMSVLVVAEPQYLRTLRPIVVPTIEVSMDDGTYSHIERTMSSTLAMDLRL
jgi:DNA primase